ncbi:helix-turn-helix domain-containing protein [Amycolatopsis thermoflava]|uniref:helix-turn-helix domain-containing protein n=1 Tax=Amycolatopsis thermoflava TaxID=84480 RepID=UPI003F4A351F
MYTRPPQQHGVTAELVTALANLIDQLRTEQVRGYRVETAAELLDVSPRTVDTLIRDKQLGCVWMGRYRVVPHVELQRFLAAGVLDTKAAA